jgi:hypothetical protein
MIELWYSSVSLANLFENFLELWLGKGGVLIVIGLLKLDNNFVIVRHDSWIRFK